jgi:hypothetical protein
MHRCLSVVMLLLLPVLSWCQDSTTLYQRAMDFPDKLFHALNRKSDKIQQRLDKSAQKYLARLQKEELKLQKQVAKKDSSAAKELFGNVSARYDSLQAASSQSGANGGAYSAHLDSMRSALQFFQKQNTTELSPAIRDKMQGVLQNYGQVQGKLNQTNLIETQLKERQQLLKDKLAQLGLLKEAKKYQQQVFYYRAQVEEYKNSFESPDKAEAKLMGIALKFPAFVKFFNRFSVLGTLFNLPGGDDLSQTAMNGLQTRSMITQDLQQRLGTGPNVQGMMNSSISEAQNSLDKVKDKLRQLGNSGSGSDVEMPDFRGNPQHTKSFLHRLETGMNLQSTKSNTFLPTTSDLGVSLGYKITSGATVGIGASYKMGWGKDIRHMSFTHEGVGLRSFAEWKWKKSLWISGGGEVNYLSAFKSVSQLNNYSGWQKSALLGLSKKYQMSKKFKGDVKLLYDFLWREQVPAGKAIVLRTGYNF